MFDVRRSVFLLMFMLGSSSYGQRARLACWRRRPAFADFSSDHRAYSYSRERRRTTSSLFAPLVHYSPFPHPPASRAA